MPNVWHHTTPVEVLLAPNRASKDLLDFNRDPTPRECCLPLVRPAQLKPPRRSVLSPLPEQAHSPTKHGREKLDSPIGKRGSEHSKGAPLRKPLKADRVRRRPQMLEAAAGLSEVRRGRPAGMLDHTTMCIYEHGSDSEQSQQIAHTSHAHTLTLSPARVHLDTLAICARSWARRIAL